MRVLRWLVLSFSGSLLKGNGELGAALHLRCSTQERHRAQRCQGDKELNAGAGRLEKSERCTGPPPASRLIE